MENRREFLKALGVGALASSVWGCRAFVPCGKTHDDALTVFLSDTHVHAEGHQRAYLDRIVSEILAMDPLPKRVVCLGDIAYLRGEVEDYRAGEPIFRRLEQAGIELHFALGNHDRRENFAAVWTEQAKRTLVPGRIVTAVDLGPCDLILLDTLHEIDDSATAHERERGWITPGQFKGEELAWLKAEMARRKRPFFLAAHHRICDITDGDAGELNDLVAECPLCIGWLHGHEHYWMQRFLQKRGAFWTMSRFDKRMVGLPSTGHWGDIGYAMMRLEGDKAVLTCMPIDHFVPAPENKTRYDEDIVAELRGAFATFRLPAALPYP